MKVRTAPDWGHAIFLVAIFGAVAWYFSDAISVATVVNNLLLIAPLSIIALALCLVALWTALRGGQAYESGAPDTVGIEIGAEHIRSTSFRPLMLIGGMAVALGLYVSALTVIGFDVGTWLFCLAAMAICGERRPIPLIVYPLAVAVILIAAFSYLLPYPLYTLVI